MKLLFIILTSAFLLSCTEDLLLSQSLLDTKVEPSMAIYIGNELIKSQKTISKIDAEVYAHDSKLLIHNGIGYCAYYSNHTSTNEGAGGQSVRLSVFDINNPVASKKIYDVFEESHVYSTVKLDKNTPCYTPVLFKTADGKIRILSKIYVNHVQKYYYRDFNPETATFTEPQVCKIGNSNSKEVSDFDLSNVKGQIKSSFNNNYKLSTDYMFATTDPVITDDGTYIGLTLGKFTEDWKTDEGTTVIMRTKDAGKSFEFIGTPYPINIVPKYNKQTVEGAFLFNNSNEVLMLGRNSIGGIFLTKSIDGGNTFSTPFSLNDSCSFTSVGSKMSFVKIRDGFLSAWNTSENFGKYNVRTVLEIRYGKNSNVCGNEAKIIIKNEFGCHYPSIYKYEDSYYITYTTDTRRLNKNSTGEIVFAKLPF